MDFFLSRRAKNVKKKRHCLKVLGVFPLKGKYVEEPVGFDHCIIIFIVNINDTLFTFERAYVFLTIYCVGLVRVSNE